MKDEQDIMKIPTVASVKSITAKIKAETKKIIEETRRQALEADMLKTEIELLKIEHEEEMKASKRSNICFSMLILSEVMSATVGNGESFSSPRLFSEDDLIEYKQKMQELLRQI